MEFQSTHPRRMRLLMIVSNFGTEIFQSTHPRRMRRVLFRYTTGGE